MQDVHVIYRQSPSEGMIGWSTYSYPESIYVGGLSLEHVRAGFLEAARFHFDDDQLSRVTLFEHIETPLVDGAYVRVAVDQRTYDREVAATAMRRSLAVDEQRHDFAQSALVTATGDAVVVACTPTDRLGWLFDQMGPHDALQITVAGPGELVWWSAIADGDAVGLAHPADMPSIADLGLTGSSTVADFVRLKTGDHRAVRVPAGAGR